jgi:predicted RNA-binding protein with PIN domain
VPDALLGPLLEAAADELRAAEPDDVPASVRHLRGFDKRGLMHGPAPRQLRQAMDRDAAFRSRVHERFAAQHAVTAILEAWAAGAPEQHVEDAAARQDLPLLASALWACRPDHAEYGLGLVVAHEAFRRAERRERDHDAARARAADEVEEARRRAEAARMTAEAELERTAAALRDERKARRDRETRAEADAKAAQRRADALHAQLEQSQATVAHEQARAEREARRSRALEEDVRRLRADATAAAERHERAPSRLHTRDADALADAERAAQRMAAQLHDLRTRVEQARAAAPAPVDERWVPVEKPLTRRALPSTPPGVVATSAAGVEGMLRHPDVLLVVDGYNVTNRAWPDASVGEQRERLGIAITQLQRRVGCEVLCVFDGDGQTARPTIRRGSVRVMFSDAGEEADEVVVREVAARPKRIPVVVVSSDGWVRQHAEAEGAVVVPADAFLALIRPAS